MIIAVDFDGTLCENAYPGIGKPNEKLIDTLKCLQEFGDILILWTARTEEKTKEAVAWCEEQGIRFQYVNENHPKVIEFFGGEDVRKIYADVYIDDKATSIESLNSRMTQFRLAELELEISELKERGRINAD